MSITGLECGLSGLKFVQSCARSAPCCSNHSTPRGNSLLGWISDVTALRYLSTVQQLLAFLGDAGISVTHLSAVQLVDAVFALRARYDPRH